MDTEKRPECFGEFCLPENASACKSCPYERECYRAMRDRFLTVQVQHLDALRKRIEKTLRPE
jgi:hypothetical protein